jgi:hypothetical protein
MASKGPVIAQDVSVWLLSARAVFDMTTVYVGSVVDCVVIAQVCLRVHHFLLPIIVPLMFHIHSSVFWDGYSNARIVKTQSLTTPQKENRIGKPS